MTEQMIGVMGDTIPQAAITNGKIAYAYIDLIGGKRKCAGYATPKALEILKLDGYGVTVECFDNGVEIPNILEAN